MDDEPGVRAAIQEAFREVRRKASSTPPAASLSRIGPAALKTALPVLLAARLDAPDETWESGHALARLLIEPGKAGAEAKDAVRAMLASLDGKQREALSAFFRWEKARDAWIALPRTFDLLAAAVGEGRTLEDALDERRDLVRREIEEAFGGIVWPPGAEIVPLRGAEQDRLRKSFRGTHWRDWASRSPAELTRCASLLPHFSREAMRFYLPAFLLARLRGPEETGDLGDAVLLLFSVSRKTGTSHRGEAHAFIAGFSAAQRQALADYFRLERDSETDPELVPDPKRFDPAIELLSPR